MLTSATSPRYLPNHLSACAIGTPAAAKFRLDPSSEHEGFDGSLVHGIVHPVMDDQERIAHLSREFGHRLMMAALPLNTRALPNGQVVVGCQERELEKEAVMLNEEVHGSASPVVDAGTLLPQLAFIPPAVIPAITNAKTKVCCYVNHSRNGGKGATS